MHALAYPIQGSCLCGKLKYELSKNIYDLCYCHCRICQRSAGAPGIAFKKSKFNVFNSSVNFYCLQARCDRSAALALSLLIILLLQWWLGFVYNERIFPGCLIPPR